MNFLFFTLYAPLGAHGEIAVGERRMSWTRPGKSAVLGLVAAAMGKPRTDEDFHASLFANMYFAVKTHFAGLPLNDYQTAQVPSSKHGRTFQTRKQEVDVDEQDLKTVLSTREWRVDSFHTVALWKHPDSTLGLDEIRTSLLNPKYHLYLGRKSAPLGLPLNPQVIDADELQVAFSKRNLTVPEKNILASIKAPKYSEIAFDLDAPGVPIPSRTERRRDGVLNRDRWSFEDRTEGITSTESEEI